MVKTQAWLRLNRWIGWQTFANLILLTHPIHVYFITIPSLGVSFQPLIPCMGLSCFWLWRLPMDGCSGCSGGHCSSSGGREVVWVEKWSVSCGVSCGRWCRSSGSGRRGGGSSAFVQQHVVLSGVVGVEGSVTVFLDTQVWPLTCEW